MSQNSKLKKDSGKIGRLSDKSIEWYRVYESRLAINLLEPWEKCLANLLVILSLVVAFYTSIWILKLFSSALIAQ